MCTPTTNGPSFDVLAPDGLRERTDISTVPPLKTAPITGRSRALSRTAARHVVLDQREERLPVPDLLGALVIKVSWGHRRPRPHVRPHALA